LIGGDDYPNICLAVAQGTLLWQPVKFEGWSQTSPGTTFTLTSEFDNGLANHKPTFKTVKTRNLAAIRPQFDDDLHLSPWHSKTDLKITI